VNSLFSPAFPQKDIERDVDMGMSKREYFAGLAMASIINDNITQKKLIEKSPDNAQAMQVVIAQKAVFYAEALIEELEETEVEFYTDYEKKMKERMRADESP